ncbi:chymotrypsin-2-like [Anopheles coustani]|uniref:chymotrypsin-2-like n=1 Tax=Anopheles coustani TaxID=139045 RepID=UPI002658B051|nr:chymotrypsin-2-like [Anopheles coustani]
MKVESFFQTVLVIAGVILLKINQVHSIVGGRTAMPGTAPYIVAVREGSVFICAGVLIKSNWVLTTAQCVNEKNLADLTILAGSHRLLTNKKNILISEIVKHTEYNTTSGAHNLALLKLAAPVTRSSRINIISLNDVTVASRIVTNLFGWGSLAYASTSYSNILQNLVQRTLSTTDCRPWIANLADGDICALIQPGQAACTRDEGGPLVNYQTNTLLGIYSYGTQCSGRVPDVFVDVYSHKTWIDATAV